MKSASKLSLGFATGFLTCALLGGTAAFAASGILAEKSSIPFFLNGSPVEVEAYLINGNHYFKLRDIAEMVDFGVTWNAESRTVGIDTMTGYVPEGKQLQAAVEEQKETEQTAYHEQASAAVFDSVYTRAAYDALRQCILTGESGPVVMSQETRTAMEGVASTVGSYPSYHLRINSDGSASFYTKYSGSYTDAASVCRAFLGTLTNQSDAEKLYSIACYICDRLEYDADSTTTPYGVFSDSSSKKGNCMSYAHSLQFLCDLADIPCIYVHSSNHQWNEVYADGKWQSVDLSSFDIGYTERGWSILMRDPADHQGRIYEQTEPQLTRFAEELLIPGSTK